ncbi:hypothetical protein LMG27952_02967 [Paraburkholderia hiiakae]|uniref:Inner membrane protein n=1 Tax=Paraburkholderia hiiakae TaxID=1081782 RepID=A0ABM8NN88_9BURK|nr:hypothetical protein LMG27952_02967 [Paraburkholderia hiiakae]
MTEKRQCHFSGLQTAALFLILVLIAVLCYLFYPTVRCVYEWGEFSDACAEEFMLTLLMPFAAFIVVWGTLFTIVALILRKTK